LGKRHILASDRFREFRIPPGKTLIAREEPKQPFLGALSNVSINPLNSLPFSPFAQPISRRFYDDDSWLNVEEGVLIHH
jgi:hypothetical protein